MIWSARTLCMMSITLSYRSSVLTTAPMELLHLIPSAQFVGD